VIAVQKSAEGIVGHSRLTEGPNKLGTVIVRKGIPDGICRAA